jgi:pimeloyl-ACP methyl ester carboxylesterase
MGGLPDRRALAKSRRKFGRPKGYGLSFRRQIISSPIPANTDAPRACAPARNTILIAAAFTFLASPVAYAAPGTAGPSIDQRKRIVETTFRSVDATLAGQWDFPERSPAPLVVIVPSSASLDRNGWPPAMGEDPDTGLYARLTEALVQNGFAVFRFDGPGTGRSSRGNYATDRSNALEAYTRAVDHARVDPDNVFMLGHAKGSTTVATIYGRYKHVVPPAGVILVHNSVGEQMSLQIDAPLLIVNPAKDPDDRYRYGEFVVEARAAPQGDPSDHRLVARSAR